MEERSEEENQEDFVLQVSSAKTVGLKICNTVIIFFLKATLTMHQCDKLRKYTVAVLQDSTVCVLLARFPLPIFKTMYRD